MKTIKNTIAEYKTPKCRVVALALGAPCLNTGSPTSEDFNEQKNLGGTWDEDDD